MPDVLDIVERYLPAEFVARIPLADRHWRGRTILLLWAIGYPLEMAWTFGMVDDIEQCRFYREVISGFDDQRLVADLDTTAAARGDDRHLRFGWLGATEVLVAESTRWRC